MFGFVIGSVYRFCYKFFREIHFFLVAQLSTSLFCEKTVNLLSITYNCPSEKSSIHSPQNLEQKLMNSNMFLHVKIGRSSNRCTGWIFPTLWNFSRFLSTLFRDRRKRKQLWRRLHNTEPSSVALHDFSSYLFVCFVVGYSLQSRSTFPVQSEYTVYVYTGCPKKIQPISKNHVYFKIRVITNEGSYLS